MFDKNNVQIPQIVELNKDVEPFIVQGTAMRSVYFNDTYKPLQFVHFSDIHAIPELWDRIVEYINYYSRYISFGLHTGDYCGGSQNQYADFYNTGIQSERPILNCVGNHDTVYLKNGVYKNPDDLVKSNKENVFKLLFNKTDNWNVDFMPGDYSMTYCKDFPESNIRLIVADFYYDFDEQKEWIKGKLEEANKAGLHVITASHTATDEITKKQNVTFQTLTDFKSLEDYPKMFLEDLLIDFKKAGGIHIANLAGHYHHDKFGHTDGGILNIAVESATAWNNWCDGKRIKDTRTFDCFNVVSVDTVSHIIKLIRVGDNSDYFLRIKHTLCYDYIEDRLIYNG